MLREEEGLPEKKICPEVEEEAAFFRSSSSFKERLFPAKQALMRLV